MFVGPVGPLAIVERIVRREFSRKYHPNNRYSRHRHNGRRNHRHHNSR